MKFSLVSVFVLVFGFVSFGQEVLAPIGMMKREVSPRRSSNLKSTTNIDSTFIYSFDTLSLPLLDEFSHSKFPNLDAQPGDPNVTEQEYYYLTDMSNVPLANTKLFSTSPTRRSTTSSTGTTTQVDLPLITIKIADFNHYPVVYSPTQVYPPYNIYDTLDVNGNVIPLSDTVYLTNPDIKQDSIVVFFAHDVSPDKYWTDLSAYHNYTHAVNPWTLGVVSFDGLDETGYPYAINTTQVGYADYLTSKTIDLSSYIPNDSIYLSFLVQSQGFNDPTEIDDSLVLEFYDAAGQEWNRVWSTRGGGAYGAFKVGHLRITNAMYLTNGFRFRFKNYGALSGMLDVFHLDYVHLRNGSGYQDTLFKDYAFVYNVGSLIEKYTQVPWEHWVNQPTHMNPNVKVTVRNGSNISENNMNGSVKVNFNGTTEGTFALNAQTLSGNQINYAPRTVYPSVHDFTGGYTFSTTPSSTVKTFDIISNAGAQFPNLALNDSSYTQQVFENVYAYDDGSPEQVYGLSQVQARLALRFEPYQADTLLGVRMCFVPSIKDLSNKLFLLTVWADDGGEPGAVIYQDEFFYPRTPIYEEGRGVYTDYLLRDGERLPLGSGAFYVGMRQIDADPLHIGFDMNNPQQSKLFFSLNGGITWANSSKPGVPMIRPIIKTMDNADLAVNEFEKEVDWNVYPNPTTGIVNIEWRSEGAFPGAVLVDSQGRTLLNVTAEDPRFDLSDAPAGIYFLRLNNSQIVKKIIR
ncbi:MAG: T9SS type A sorting domain-containing protein [Fluviicola sp.]